MNRKTTFLIVLILSCLLFALKPVRAQEKVDSSDAGFGTITGTVTYRQRSAIPPNTLLLVRLEDVSRQDASSRLIAGITLPTGGKQVPIGFALPYRRTDIDDAHRYQVRASLTASGKMLFTTTTANPVLTNGAASTVNLIVQPVASSPSSGSSTFPPDIFVNRVWKVSQSAQVATGQMYTFLSDGTLVIASAHGKPAFGSWAYKNGQFSIVEEGRRYPVKILALTPEMFRLRMSNPGTPVEMTLIPARR